MRIKKLGHCCLIIEENGKRIMTDPGFWTAEVHVKEKDIDIILLTHEHGDHLHIGSLKEVLTNNPLARIITNAGVGKFLNKENIRYEILENVKQKDVAGFELEPHECKHEEIFKEKGQVQNTGFFINRRLFYPGDSFYDPQKPVEILALPVAGPWVKVGEAMRYALTIKPSICFPVHDGMLISFGANHSIPAETLPEYGIQFIELDESIEKEF